MTNEEIKKKKIAVLMGGLSKEREISFKSGKAVLRALRESGYENVFEIDAGYDLAEKLTREKAEIAFIALHGRYGEDGTVQGLLEYLKIPYTGSGVLGSAVSMDKAMSKRIFENEGIPSAPYLVFESGMGVKTISKAVENCGFGFPVVVKPSREGSTIGLSVAKDSESLKKAIKDAFEYDPEIVVEKYIAGKEITVGILDGDPLPLVEIVPKSGLFDYKAKYTKGMTEYFVPARVSRKVTRQSQDIASDVFRVLQCYGFGRVDFIVDKDENLFVLELNSIPGMTDTSLVPMAARETGLSFNRLIEKIIGAASLKVGG